MRHVHLRASHALLDLPGAAVEVRTGRAVNAINACNKRHTPARVTRGEIAQAIAWRNAPETTTYGIHIEIE